MKRCLNLDWLEVYCHELQAGYPHDADYFRAQGFYVEQRPYGTRVYADMFTVYDTYNQPFIEIRRLPLAVKKNTEKSVIDPMSCHLRFNNRYCYYHNAAEIMQQFIHRYGFQYIAIARVDLCLDFEKFDSGDEPATFIRRYLNQTYAKINQSEISAHGKDQWDGIQFNSLSWGSPTSPIGTKIYDKTLEIKTHSKPQKDKKKQTTKYSKPYKPWIPQAWVQSGLLTDFQALTKTLPDGTVYSPRIWRLEFSIRSKVKNWVTLKNSHRNDTPHKYLSYRNDLDIYQDDQRKLTLFASLVHQYFFFRKYDKGKRKYDCPEKKLFNFNPQDTLVKVEKPLTTTRDQSRLTMLLHLLEDYREHKVKTDDIIKIYDVTEMLKIDINRAYLDKPFDPKLQLLLQQLLSLATAAPGTTYEENTQFIDKILKENDPPF